MGNVIEINNGLIGFARFQCGCVLVAIAVGEIEKANGDAG